MSNKKSKKANISLSVNSIVVLVMAMVMLGLGLGFTRSMFGGISSQVEEQTSQIEDPIVSYDTPIKLSSEKLLAKPNENKVLKVSVFNTNNTADLPITISVYCSAFTKVQVPSAKTVKAGGFDTWSIALIKAKQGVEDLCYLNASLGTSGSLVYSTEFFIQVS